MLPLSYFPGQQGFGFSYLPTDPSGFLISGGPQARFGMIGSYNITSISTQPDNYGIGLGAWQGILNPTDSAGSLFGINIVPIVEATNSENPTKFIGVGSYPGFFGTGSLGNLYGAYLTTDNGGTGTVTGNQVGVYIAANKKAVGATTSGSSYGLYIEDESSTGAAVSNLNLISKGLVSMNLFEGSIEIGTYLTVDGSSAPAVSPAGKGRIYFDSTLNKFRVSENGGAYVNMV